jgi:hypothetical protein
LKNLENFLHTQLLSRGEGIEAYHTGQLFRQRGFGENLERQRFQNTTKFFALIISILMREINLRSQRFSGSTTHRRVLTLIGRFGRGRGGGQAIRNRLSRRGVAESKRCEHVVVVVVARKHRLIVSFLEKLVGSLNGQ